MARALALGFLYRLTVPIKGSRPTGQLPHWTMPASPLHRVVMSRFSMHMDHDICVKQSRPSMYRQRRQL